MSDDNGSFGLEIWRQFNIDISLFKGNFFLRFGDAPISIRSSYKLPTLQPAPAHLLSCVEVSGHDSTFQELDLKNCKVSSFI